MSRTKKILIGVGVVLVGAGVVGANFYFKREKGTVVTVEAVKKRDLESVIDLDRDFHRAIAVARQSLAGERTRQVIIDRFRPTESEALLDRGSSEAQPLVCHLFAHPCLIVLHQVDQNHRSTRARHPA